MRHLKPGMPKSHKLSIQAEADYAEILSYIARDNPIAARRVKDALEAAFSRLSEYPHLGHLRDDVTSKRVRFWGVHSYQIVYDSENDPLVILRILSGWRDIGDILDDGWLE